MTQQDGGSATDEFGVSIRRMESTKVKAVEWPVNIMALRYMKSRDWYNCIGLVHHPARLV